MRDRNLLNTQLQRYFGFDRFKGQQEEVIDSILDGNDTFVLMPTGGGKSLCYQLPALMQEGTAIVISPLIALMKNQVDAMRSFSMDDGVAHFLNSSLSKTAIQKVKEDIGRGQTKLLYVAPESLTKLENIDFLKGIKISFYAIDEAHCISEWGHDFRPEYRRIRPIVNEIGEAPLMALTATATPKVQHDIQKNLGMNNAMVFKSSFNRPNLYYEIRPKVKAKDQIIRMIKSNLGKSGIIYCLSRKKVEEIAELLQVNGIKALAYHAGMDSATRSTNQDKFLMEEADVIVATIAFGMGKLPYYEINIDNELVDKQIEGYANRFGENIPAEQIGDKETVIGDFVQLDENGIVLEGGISANNVQVSIQLIRDEEIKARFIGAKVGEVLKFNPRIAYANDHEIAHLLKIKPEEIESLTAEFNFTINKISTFIPAEVNEDLIKKVYGDETEIKTIEEFREKISSELIANLKYSSEYRFLVDVKEVLTKYAAMQLPEEFLKRWLVETNEKVTAEQIDQEFDNFRKDLEWNLIKSKLVKENEITVTEEDIRIMAGEMAMMQFRQYGMFNVPDEYLNNYANSILKNEDEKHRMSEKKIEDKVLTLIKEKAEIKTIKVTQKEFDDLFEK